MSPLRDMGDEPVVVAEKGDEIRIVKANLKDWSPEVREDSLRRILTNGDEANLDNLVPGTEIVDTWASHLAQVVPFRDWLALWKSSPDSPGVFVDVNQVMFKSLQVEVRLLHIKAASDEIEQENTMEDSLYEDEYKTVSLLELYPVQDDEDHDEEDPKDCEKIALALEHCRFFFENLWFPWDDQDEDDNWVGEHLSVRCQLHQDPDSRAWMELQGLAREYRELQDEMTAAEREENQDEARILELEDREHQIKRSAMITENPALRDAVRARRRGQKEEVHGPGRVHHLVWSPQEDSFQEFKTFLDAAEKVLKDGAESRVSHCRSVAEAVEQALEGDVIVLAPGRHTVHSLGDVASGGGEVVGVKRGREKVVLVTRVVGGDLGKAKLTNVKVEKE